MSMSNDDRLKIITAISRTLGRWEAEWREICILDCREQNDNDNVGAPRLAAPLAIRREALEVLRL